MIRRLLTVAVAAVVAYGAGFAADAVLNEDRCAGANRTVMHWLPISEDCKVRQPNGRVKVERGDSEVFTATAGAVFLIALVLLTALASLVKVVVILGAVVGAGYVIFA